MIRLEKLIIFQDTIKECIDNIMDNYYNDKLEEKDLQKLDEEFSHYKSLFHHYVKHLFMYKLLKIKWVIGKLLITK